MHGYLRQSTASQSRMVGPFMDVNGAVQTGLTIASTDVQLNKNGAASVNKNSGGGLHRSNGFYNLVWDATDSDTVGELAGSIVVAPALVVTFRYTVLEEAVYDALFASGALGITDAQANKIADHVIRRTLANARASSDGDAVTFRSLLGAASKLVNRVDASGTPIVIYQENDTTSFGSQTKTTNAAAEPITQLNTV